jgi:hypothetical protein
VDAIFSTKEDAKEEQRYEELNNAQLQKEI